MAKSDKRLLRDLELEVMNEIWRMKKLPLRGVFAEIVKRRKIAYTTVATVVERLVVKGFIKRHDDQPIYHYSANISQREVIGAFVNHIKNHIFEGRKYLH